MLGVIKLLQRAEVFRAVPRVSCRELLGVKCGNLLFESVDLLFASKPHSLAYLLLTMAVSASELT